MIGYNDNVRFELFSIERGIQVIPPIQDYERGNADVLERDDERGTFITSKPENITVAKEGRDYLLFYRGLYGVKGNVRLREFRKDRTSVNERWIQVSNVGVNLSSLTFTETTASFESIEGGMMQIIDSRFNDDYDILLKEDEDGNAISDIPTVNVRLDARQILRRSLLRVEDGTEVGAIVSGADGLNARAIPYKVVYNSDRNDVQEVLGDQLSASSGNYASVTADKVRNVLYFNANIDTKVVLNGRVETRITQANSGTFDLDIIIYENGVDLNFKRKINLDNCNPNVIGDTCIFEFNEYELDILEGESFAIGTLSNTSDGIRYEIFGTSINIKEETLFPVTYTQAIRPFDLFTRLVYLITGEKDAFRSSLFETGGKYEDLLITHGTFIRNMPKVLNEGEDDERKLQASISLEDAINGYKIKERLVFQAITVGNKEYFTIEPWTSTFREFRNVRLGTTTNSVFQYLSTTDEERDVLGDNYFSTITIGSNSSGSNYEEVNNLYSTAGKATWNTMNTASESKYEVTTDIRTGAEDVEIIRQNQYTDNPDIDTDMDNDFFFLDCFNAGFEYRLKKWDAYFETQPQNVYSYETNYNWCFIPSMLLQGHSSYINSGLTTHPNENLRFISSNCNSSLVTRLIGGQDIAEDGNVPHSRLDKARFIPLLYRFKLPITDIIEQALLARHTDGTTNMYGKVTFRSSWDGQLYNGIIIKVDKNNEGNWELIESV
ncbi:hypothetical protein [Spongiimicrobium salis]|uniref:hypothetical protein n=1 Tax=Spongiimicrobium salis TaxID=1667022 RepID=UPI00374CB14D